MPPVRQPSFAAGEFAPALHSRVDLEQYGHGARRLRNFFVGKHGTAVSRPGTRFVCRGKFDAKQVRLLPFRYADDESYCLELGDLYLRFVASSAQLKVNSGAPVEVVTPYTEAQLPRVRHVQSGDILTLTHPEHTPRMLKRQDGGFVVATASITKIAEFTAQVTLPNHGLQTGDLLTVVLGGAEIYFNAGAFTVTVTSSSVFTYDDTTSSGGSVSPTNPITFGVNRFRWTLEEVTFDVPSWFGAASYRAVDPVPTVDSGHPVVEWAYQVTTVGRTLAGMLVESLPVAVTLLSTGGALASELAIYSDRPLSLDFSGAVGVLPAHVQSFVGYRIYRGRSGTFGFVGERKGAQVTTWKDHGQEPDFSIPPPSGRNPFEVLAANGSTVLRTEEPVAVCYYEDRLVFAGTAERPGHVFASASGSYTNFDERSPSTADEALEFELVSRTREEIRNLVPRDRLLVFTDSSVWSAGGADGSMSATNQLDARVHVEIGASHLAPLPVRQSVLFARAKGMAVLDLVRTEQGYGAVEVSELASHLFEGLSVVDWTYAEDPWGVVWVVRSDGRLLSFTPGRMGGWAWHDTYEGAGASQLSTPVHKFESVCAVAEGTEDGVYVAVQRVAAGVTIRTIERMTNRLVNDSTPLADLVCLDAAYTYEGVSAPSITGLTWLAGRDVYAVADGLVQGPITVSAAGVALLTTAALKVQIGLRYFPELETLDFPDGRTHKKAVRKVSFEVYASKGLFTGETFDALSEWEEGAGATGLITGLAEVRVQHAWNTNGGRAVLRQTLPFPITVVGVIRGLEVGGDS